MPLTEDNQKMFQEVIFSLNLNLFKAMIANDREILNKHYEYNFDTKSYSMKAIEAIVSYSYKGLEERLIQSQMIREALHWGAEIDECTIGAVMRTGFFTEALCMLIKSGHSNGLNTIDHKNKAIELKMKQEVEAVISMLIQAFDGRVFADNTRQSVLCCKEQMLIAIKNVVSVESLEGKKIIHEYLQYLAASIPPVIKVTSSALHRMGLRQIKEETEKVLLELAISECSTPLIKTTNNQLDRAAKSEKEIRESDLTILEDVINPLQGLVEEFPESIKT